MPFQKRQTDTPDTVIFSYFPSPNYTTAGSEAFKLKKLPGNPEMEATLAYDHTFALGNALGMKRL